MHTAFSNCSSFLPEHERFFCTLCTTTCSSKANIQEESLVMWVSWNFAEQHAKYLLFINKDKIKICKSTNYVRRNCASGPNLLQG